MGDTAGIKLLSIDTTDAEVVSHINDLTTAVNDLKSEFTPLIQSVESLNKELAAWRVMCERSLTVAEKILNWRSLLGITVPIIVVIALMLGAGFSFKYGEFLIEAVLP